jgi:hypothetical protein
VNARQRDLLRRCVVLVSIVVSLWFAVLGTAWALFAAGNERSLAAAWVSAAVVPTAVGVLVGRLLRRTRRALRRAVIGVHAAGVAGLVVYVFALYSSLS